MSQPRLDRQTAKCLPISEVVSTASTTRFEKFERQSTHAQVRSTICLESPRIARRKTIGSLRLYSSFNERQLSPRRLRKRQTGSPQSALTSRSLVKLLVGEL